MNDGFDYGENDESWDRPINDDMNDGIPEPRRRRRRFNPERIRRKISVKRNLPSKFSKEMTIRKAKKLIYGARTPGRPSRLLSEQLREAKKVLQSAGLPLQRKTTKAPAIRGRGRPKKLPSVKKEKRPRGRPRKNPTAVIKLKRPRGRPKKLPSPITRPKRPRGRPRKNPLQQLADSAKKRTARKNHTDDAQD